MRRALVASLIVNGVLTLVLLGWVTWIVVEPRYWFENAYLQQGPRGDKGPRGDRGPVGPEGPVGPDAADAYDELSYTVDEARSGVDDLDSRLSDIEDEFDNHDDSDLEIIGDDAEAALYKICSAINLNYLYASNSAIEELLSDLNDACP